MALAFPDISPALVTIPAVHVGSLNLGPFPIRWYALAYIAGIILGWLYAARLVSERRLWGPAGPPTTREGIDDLILWITVGIIVGGRVGSILFYTLTTTAGRAELAHDPFEALRLWDGGMSFHGGAIGVTLALILFARARKLSLFSLADVAAAVTPIGLFFGRVANFINGELWGRVTDVPWGMMFCTRHIVLTYGKCPAGLTPRHPSQLYEAALEGVALFLVLRLATHRFGWLTRPGAVTGLFLLGYGLARTSLENVRMPDEGLRDLPFGITMGMILSWPMILFGLFLIWRAFRVARAAPKPA